MEIIRNINSYEDLNDLIENEESIIIYFGTDAWSICGAVFPQLENVGSKYDIKIIKINVDSQLELSGQFLAFVMPTILIFNGGKEIVRESRFIDFNRIQRSLELLFGQTV